MFSTIPSCRKCTVNVTVTPPAIPTGEAAPPAPATPPDLMERAEAAIKKPKLLTKPGPKYTKSQAVQAAVNEELLRRGMPLGYAHTKHLDDKVYNAIVAKALRRANELLGK